MDRIILKYIANTETLNLGSLLKWKRIKFHHRNVISFSAVTAFLVTLLVTGNIGGCGGVGHDREDRPNRSYRKQPLLL